MSRRNRARQFDASTLGLVDWQSDFWLTLIEHALIGQLGRPDLSQTSGFEKPAVTRFAVTTLKLWHSFDRYNARKPYHKQVRPFGFMITLQQTEDSISSNAGSLGPRKSRRRKPPSMHVMAPFDRDPAKAAKKAFDRDTNEAVSPKTLKSYAEALKSYYNHPESKFLNGGRGDHGPTQRRHIIAKSIRHIGKEANKLGEQLALGIDPDAQAEFGTISESVAVRVRRVQAAVKHFGASDVSRKAGISRQYLFQLLNAEATASEEVWAKIDQAISMLELAEAKQDEEAYVALTWLRTECERIGLRQLAQNLGKNAGHLSRMIGGSRRIPTPLVRAINAGLS
jgi:hypothetical protein